MGLHEAADITFWDMAKCIAFLQLKAQCVKLTLFLLPFLRGGKTPHCPLMVALGYGDTMRSGHSCLSG